MANFFSSSLIFLRGVSLLLLLSFCGLIITPTTNAQETIDLSVSGKEYADWEIMKPIRRINDIEEFGGYYWFAGTGGLIQVNKEDSSDISTYRMNNSIFSTTSVTSLSVSGDSVLIAGTSNGIHFISKNGDYRSLTNQNASFPFTGVFDVLYDHSKTLWIAMSSGLVRISENGSTNFYTNLNSPLRTNDVFDIELANDNALWIGSMGMFRIDSTGQWTDFGLPTNSNNDYQNSIYDIEISPAGKVFARSRSNNFYAFNGGDWTQWTPENTEMISPDITTFTIDKNGDLWLGYYTENTSGNETVLASRYNGETWTHISTQNNLYRTRLLNPSVLFSDGNMLFAGLKEEGIFSLTFSDSESASPEWEKFVQDDFVQFPGVIRTLHADKNGHIWINRERSLLKYDGTKWISYHDIFRLGQQIRHLTSDQNGNIWFLTFNTYKSMGYFNPATEELVVWDSENTDGLPDSEFGTVNDLIIDPSNTPWIVMAGQGILRYNGTEWETVRDDGQSHFGYMSQLAAAPDGTIFFASGDYDDNTLEYYNESENEWIRYSHVPGIWDRYTTLTTDKDGNVWAGVDIDKLYFPGVSDPPPGYGAALISDSSHTRYTPDNSGVPGLMIRDIHVDASNQVWIATQYDGLAQFDQESWSTFTTRNSPLLNHSLVAVSSDKNGNVWLATWNEVYKITGGVGVSVEDELTEELPSSIQLHSVYPNPFNPTTTLRFKLSSADLVRVDVFNLLGQRVDVLINERLSAGTHQTTFNAEGLASGIYLFRVTTSESVQTVKGLLIK